MDQPVTQGERVRYLREVVLGLDRQADFGALVAGAHRSPFRQETVSRWENSETIDVKTLRMIADVAEPRDEVFRWLREGGRMPRIRRISPQDRESSPSAARASAEEIFRAEVELRRAQGAGFTPAEVLDLHARYLENRSEDERAMRDGGGDPRDSGPYAATQ